MVAGGWIVDDRLARSQGRRTGESIDRAPARCAIVSPGLTVAAGSRPNSNLSVSESASSATVLAGGRLRTFVEEQTSVAWGAVRIGGPRGEESGRLLHGPMPDLLLIQSFPEEQAELRSRIWPHLVGIAPESGGLFEHELRVAIEIELSEKADLSGKIQNNQAATNLGWFHATLWVTDTPAVATRLLRSMRALSAAGDAIGHHYFAHTADVGIDPAGPPYSPPYMAVASLYPTCSAA